MCESVTPHTKAFELHLRSMGKKSKAGGESDVFDGCEVHGWEAARSDQVW